MSYKFSITMKDLNADIDRIRKEIETMGGIFQGDSNKGTIVINPDIS